MILRYGYKLTGLTIITVIVMVNLCYAQCNNPLNLGTDTAVCALQNFYLDAGPGYGSYSWQDNSTSRLFQVTQAGTYSCTTTNVDFSTNYVVNGNFEQGNTGFTTSYTFYNIADINGPQATYGITTNAQSWFNPFNPCTDYTTGTGNMLIADGATNPNASVWCQTIAVQPNTQYQFSYWVQNVVGFSPANLSVEINGQVLGNDFAPTTACSWQQRVYNWSSATSATATICIYDLSTSANGNDFALDNLELYEVCSYFDEITISVLPPTRLFKDTVICQGNSIVLEGEPRFVPGIYNDTVNSNGCLTITETTLQVVALPVANILGSVVLKQNEVLQLMAQDTSVNYSYQWTKNGMVVANTAQLVDTPASASTYCLTVTSNGCMGVPACKSIIFVEQGMRIFLPTAFSPNNDGVNDQFEILNFEDFSYLEMRIYDKWGALVYAEIGRSPAWNGNIKSNAPLLGVYAYVVKGQSLSTGNTLTKVGNVTVTY